MSDLKSRGRGVSRSRILRKSRQSRPFFFSVQPIAPDVCYPPRHTASGMRYEWTQARQTTGNSVSRWFGVESAWLTQSGPDMLHCRLLVNGS